MNRLFFFRSVVFSLITLLVLGTSSCSIEEPNFSNVGNFKMKKLDGKRVEAEFTVDCENPNGFGFKVKRANIHVSANDQVLGDISLDQKVKIKRKSNNTYTIPIVIDLEDGALFKIMKLSLSGEVNVNLKGKIRGSVAGIGKTLEVDENRKVDASSLNLEGLGG